MVWINHERLKWSWRSCSWWVDVNFWPQLHSLQEWWLSAHLSPVFPQYNHHWIMIAFRDDGFQHVLLHICHRIKKRLNDLTNLQQRLPWGDWVINHQLWSAQWRFKFVYSCEALIISVILSKCVETSHLLSRCMSCQNIWALNENWFTHKMYLCRNHIGPIKQHISTLQRLEQVMMMMSEKNHGNYAGYNSLIFKMLLVKNTEIQ